MDKVTMVGIDLAKDVFWLHWADERGRKVFSKKMSRTQLPEFVVNLQTCTSEPICKDNLFDDFSIKEGLLAPNPNTWINKDKKTVNKSLNYKTDLI